LQSEREASQRETTFIKDQLSVETDVKQIAKDTKRKLQEQLKKVRKKKTGEEKDISYVHLHLF
jgi:hypothetical protein